MFVSMRIQNLPSQGLPTLDCKDIGMLKSEFVHIEVFTNKFFQIEKFESDSMKNGWLYGKKMRMQVILYIVNLSMTELRWELLNLLFKYKILQLIETVLTKDKSLINFYLRWINSHESSSLAAI